MELDALEAEALEAVQLLDRPGALARVDAAEAEEGVRMFFDRLRHELVGEARPAGRGLGVPGEQDADEIQVDVFARKALDRVARDR